MAIERLLGEREKVQSVNVRATDLPTHDAYK